MASSPEASAGSRLRVPAPPQRAVHSLDQLVDQDGTAGRGIDPLAILQGASAHGDVDPQHELVDGDRAAAVAIADAGGVLPQRLLYVGIARRYRFRGIVGRLPVEAREVG